MDFGWTILRKKCNYVLSGELIRHGADCVRIVLLRAPVDCATGFSRQPDDVSSAGFIGANASLLHMRIVATRSGPFTRVSRVVARPEIGVGDSVVLGVLQSDHERADVHFLSRRDHLYHM